MQLMRKLIRNIAFTSSLVLSGIVVSAQNLEEIHTNQSGGKGNFLMAFITVFLILFLFYIILKFVNKYSIRKQKKNSQASAAIEGKSVIHEEISGEVFAAISTALYLYETEQHDYESAILTINRATKNYSPWSSKIYGLRQIPRK
jgi:large-conductance mechanosensitive channel